MTDPSTPLDPADIAELGELVQFLDAWLACDHEHLDQSLIRFVGHHAFNINRLREDLGRFAVLLGAEPDPSSQPAQQPCPDPVDVPF
jgi:hypothetical protein